MAKIIVIVILIFICVHFIRSRIGNYHFKFDTITHFQGANGSGKTTILSILAWIWKHHRHMINSFIRIINAILPKKIDYVCEEVYSNYPIYFGRMLGWSKVCDKSIWLWDYKIPEDCLIVYDELANDFPAVKQGQAVLSDDLEKWCFRWCRHATGFTAYTACQSLSEVNKNIRQKVQHCYTLSNCNIRRFRKSSVNVIETYASEDIKTIYTDSDKDHIDNVYKFRYRKNLYESRYGRQFYNLEKPLLKYIASNTDKILALLGLKCGDSWNCFEYNIKYTKLADFTKYLERLRNEKKQTA